MFVRQLVGSVSVSICALVLAIPGMADPQTRLLYSVEGSDAFRTGRSLSTRITYAGSQRLTMTPQRDGMRLAAQIDYERGDGTATAHLHGAFRARQTPAGDQVDEVNDDPDYLTVLNQPFAVQLDAATMRDLRGLRDSVPFDFPSPMTGAPLHGVLRRLSDGQLAGERVLGIAFTAAGPLHGSLPDRPGVALTGRIAMSGTAFYGYGGNVLRGLDATLRIDGVIDQRSDRQTVTIVYRRTIRSAR